MKRPNQKTYAQLKKKLDETHSIYIRREAADKDGIASCITCGIRKHWKELQASHFISRSYLSTRWLDSNVHPACYTCNVLRHGNMIEYAVWMNENYGWTAIEDLREMKHKKVKYTRDDLQQKINYYQQKIDSLK